MKSPPKHAKPITLQWVASSRAGRASASTSAFDSTEVDRARNAANMRKALTSAPGTCASDTDADRLAGGPVKGLTVDGRPSRWVAEKTPIDDHGKRQAATGIESLPASWLTGHRVHPITGLAPTTPMAPTPSPWPRSAPGAHRFAAGAGVGTARRATGFHRPTNRQLWRPVLSHGADRIA